VTEAAEADVGSGDDEDDDNEVSDVEELINNESEDSEPVTPLDVRAALALPAPQLWEWSGVQDGYMVEEQSPTSSPVRPPPAAIVPSPHSEPNANKTPSAAGGVQEAPGSGPWPPVHLPPRLRLSPANESKRPYDFMITYGAHSVKDSTGDIGDVVWIACTNLFLYLRISLIRPISYTTHDSNILIRLLCRKCSKRARGYGRKCSKRARDYS
jgi:hypothetical protein